MIAENGTPVGKIQDGDSVILFNFRGDRALEISMAFDDDEFPYFDRGVRPQVKYAGMLAIRRRPVHSQELPGRLRRRFVAR